MSYSVYASRRFQKQAKRLQKKYPSLSAELNELEKELLENPNIGTPLGNNCYKVRVAVRSKGKGKRGGMRVITWVLLEVHELVSLLAIYDKSEQDTISTEELKFHIGLLKAELGLEK